jgi:phage terminase Nu1 subunit (DNA packaging protein)
VPKTKQKNLKSHLSQVEFAKLVNRNPSVISRLITRGILTKGASWKTWINQILDHYEAIAAGRSSAGLNLVDERAKLARAQSTKINFDLAIQRRQFLSTKAIAERVTASHMVLRSKLLALPTRIASRLPAFAKAIFKPLDEIIRECLTEISQITLPTEVMARIDEIEDQEFKRATENCNVALAGNEAKAPDTQTIPCRNGTRPSAQAKKNRSRSSKKPQRPMAGDVQSVATATENQGAE